ncbi:DUF2914 domain-containing protein [Agarivorans aestuarii]|uniref:DUF2914 domain-containing protein n=1 Tax=Agarivorans aestuarii TaxID=1563703 RepID=A0ABU7G9D4_9ALTE|nr:DUF2914 domain-containing protein [Agarivorans aestuarii]MEE1675997.1 DUF2914 domain-containing protein [Agarivorans aestuarii]
MAEQVSIKIHLNASASQTATIDKVPAPKPPFDLRKIFAAVLVLILLIAGLLHFIWPAQAEPTADANATTQQASSQIESAVDKAQLPKAEASAEHSPIGQSQVDQAQIEQTQVEPTQALSAQSSAAMATEEQPKSSEAEASEEPKATVADTAAESMLVQPETNTVQPSQPLAEELPDNTKAATAEQANEQSSQPVAQTDINVDAATAELEPSAFETSASTNDADTDVDASLEQTSTVSPHVTRAQLSSAISQREPIDNLTYVALSEIQQVYLFMELRELQGQSIQVNWYQQNQLQASVDLNIGGPRWRTNASKRFTAQSRGEWQVVIVNQQQVRIFEQNFTVK